MPKEPKDFCCLIVCGFGTGHQAGLILQEHLQNSGIDAFLTHPSGSEQLRIECEHWVHGVRMDYLDLRRTYRRVVLVGLSVGGMLLIHMLDLNPAAVVFVNTPCVQSRSRRTLSHIFQEDLQPRITGFVRTSAGRRQLRRLAEQTCQRNTSRTECPALVLQTKDDKICPPSNADALYKQLHFSDKTLRLYPEGGHDVLTSRTVLAVCSDIFQFCTRVRADGQEEIE